MANEDFNNDGIKDYLIYRMSSGMLGGNANTNASYFYCIMRNDLEPHYVYEILGYAPFSHNVLGEMTYENRRLSGVASQNHRTYISAMGELESTPVSFIYKDDNLYEESYLTKCEMAQMTNINIFKVDLPNTARGQTIDMHNFCREVYELHTESNTEINATLTGCDNLGLQFQFKILNSHPLYKSEDYKQLVSQGLALLLETTRYESVLRKVEMHYLANVDEHTKEVEASFDNTWSYSISSVEHKNRSLSYTIQLTNLLNPNQIENWGVTARKSR